MIKELTGGNRRVVAFLKVEEHSASLAHMNEGGMAKRYFCGVKKIYGYFTRKFSIDRINRCDHWIINIIDRCYVQ